VTGEASDLGIKRNEGDLGEVAREGCIDLPYKTNGPRFSPGKSELDGMGRVRGRAGGRVSAWFSFPQTWVGGGLTANHKDCAGFFHFLLKRNIQNGSVGAFAGSLCS